MADERRKPKIRSSATPDYSDRDELLEQIGARDEKAREYYAAAKEHDDLAASEKLAKAELLSKTGLAAFVTKRCEERGLKFDYEGFWIDNASNLRNDVEYFILRIDGNSASQNIKKMNCLIGILEEIGISKDHIKKWLKYAHPLGEDGKKMKEHPLPAESLYIPIDQSVITGLIEKETEKRLEPIKQRFERAARLAASELGEVSRMIAKTTEDEIADEHPELEMGFSEKHLESAREAIRRKVTDELLGRELTKSAGKEEGREA